MSNKKQEQAAVEKEKRRRIVWNQEEWDKVFNEALRARIEAAGAEGHLPLSVDGMNPGCLTPIEIHNAGVAVIPEDRAREIHTVKRLFSPWMMQAFVIWEQLMYQEQAIKVAEAAAQLLDPAPAPAKVDEEQDKANAKKANKRERERHEWNEDQWQAVCDELIRRIPITMQSSTLIGVKMKDIESAARKLWEDEPIPTFAMSEARVKLLECVARANANAKQVQVAEAKATADSPLGALMKAVIEELVKGLAPALLRMEANIVERTRNELSNSLHAVLGAHVGTERRETTVRQNKVAIVGGYNKPHHLEQTLKEKFPQYRFIMLGRDPHNFADTLKHCDLVLCNVEGISHATARGVKNAAPVDAYRQVTGGESNLIRAIETFSKSKS